MSKRHSRFTAFMGLSPKGQEIVIAGAKADKPQRQIQNELKEATGEEFSNGAISRFIKVWREQEEQAQAADAQANRIIRAMKANDVEGPELAEALIKQAMFENMDAAGEISLEKSIPLQIRMMDIELKKRNVAATEKRLEVAEREVEIKQRTIDAKDSELEAIRNRAKKAQKEIERRKDLPKDIVQQLHELYGIDAEDAA